MQSQHTRFVAVLPCSSEALIAMLQSSAFLPVPRENQAEALVGVNNLAIRAGLVRRVAAGVYAILPISLTVLGNIAASIRRHSFPVGTREFSLRILQPAQW